MKKYLHTIMKAALASTFILAGTMANAQTSSKAVTERTDQLRIPSETDGGGEGTEGTGGTQETDETNGVDRLLIFPNPIISNIVTLTSTSSGIMNLKMYALSGPSIGIVKILAYGEKYTANSRRPIVLRADVYNGTWLVVGTIGRTLYKQQIQVAR